MKTFLLAFAIVLAFPVFGQNNPTTAWFEFISFENDWGYDTSHVKLEIDTSNANNIWQIGQPQKTLFYQAFSPSNAIVTDTVNSYPINDTSSFVITYRTYGCPYIEGYYYCDTDSLNDYGMVEYSLDNGQTWVRYDDSLCPSNSNLILTGNSVGWQLFNLCFDYLNGTSWDVVDTTFLLKFTFISDSIDTQHEGLMFDNLGFCILANTNDLSQANNLKVFPNPSSSTINFEFETALSNVEIRVYSSTGQLAGQSVPDFSTDNVQFDVSDWHNGIYFYGVFVEGRLAKQGQVLVQH
jgi:hypothetical protein